jgi:Ca-activated chloride channel homolog
MASLIRSPRSLCTLFASALIMIYAGCGGGWGDDMLGGDPYHGDAFYDHFNDGIDDHEEFKENEFISTADEDTSTFSIDVNTASYTIMRRAITNGSLPAQSSVRVEEYINFFRFDYPEPVSDPFSINMEIAPSYFGSSEDQDRHLLRIGMKGRDVSIEEMKPTNLVFLVDVSGSMSPEVRLPLAKQALHVMLEYLRPTDTVGIQTYASGSDTVLEPTPVANRQQIEAAIDSLVAQGATYGEGGIRDAYDMAEEAFIEGGNNRVVILTDGDFNVGKVGDDLVEMVKGYRERQISLTSVGFGHGGYGDATMERLARKGNGNYFYIDTIEEAYRIFGSELPSTVEVIAHDVRNQVQFNADAVDRYRLVGYEKRVMDNDDFDREDTNAGEIGPGHTVTAFYELELHDDADQTDFLAEVRVRYKEQYEDETELIERQIKFSEVLSDFHDASEGFRFAAAVAQFAAILRGSQYVDDANFDEVRDIAEDGMYEGYANQAEFLDLVDAAAGLWSE